MLRWAALLLLFAGARSVHAADVPTAVLPDSGTVEGMVVDAATGSPLPGTIVRVVGLGRRDITHEGGEYHLRDLPAGTHTLLFERLGYHRAVREVDVASGETVPLRVELHASAITLPGIVITGTTSERLGDATVRPAAVISGQELSRNLDVTLAGTLAKEAGLSMTSIGPATGRPIIRGLGGDRVLVLEDGARVGDLSSASSDHALSVDPLTAQRIEVVRGPSALLYGSNAIGGVINLIREEVPASLPERATGVVSLQGQSVNEGLAGGASGQVAVGSTALRAEGSYRRAGDLDTPEGTLSNTDLQTFSLSAGASRVRATGHYGAAYRYYDNDYGIPGGFVGSHPGGVRIEMQRHSVHAEAVQRGRFGPFNSLDLDGKYTHYHHRELEENDILGTEFGLITAAAEMLARHEAWGPFSGGGVGARLDWEDYAAGGSTQTPPSRSWTGGLFVLEEVSIGRMQLEGGGRFEWHRVEPLDTTAVRDIGRVRTRTFSSFAASLGAVYPLATGVRIGASAARAYRTPGTDELFSQGPHLAAYSYEVGNPDLEPEVGIGLEAFIRVTRDRFNGEAAAFRNMLDNYIHYVDSGTLSPTGLPVYQAAGTDAVLQGVELSGSAEVVRHFVVDATISLVRGHEAATDRPLPMIPPLNGQLTLRYEQPRYFAGLTWRATADQDRVAEFETPTRGTSILNGDAGLRWVAFGRVQSVTLRVDNITNQVAYDHLSRIRNRETGERAAAAGLGASAIYRVMF